MITIYSQTIADAWKDSFLKLYENGNVLTDQELLRDECIAIEVSNVENNRFNNLFPMNKDLIDEYNKYVIEGGEKGNVQDEHAIYHNRLFGKETILNNQIEFIISTLKKNPFAKRAQASLWSCDPDQSGNFTPCLQIIWARVRNGKLELHAHMRANDAYWKSLMNMNIFTTIQKYISRQLGVETGRYIHFVDSYHFHANDKKEIESLYNTLITS